MRTIARQSIHPPSPPHRSNRHFVNRLQGVNKVRADVAQVADLVLGLSFGQIVPLAHLAQAVFAPQHEVLDDGSTKQADKHVRKNRAVASPVSRLLLRHVDVRGDDAVHVAPANDDADHDTAFQRAFDIVGRPRKSIGDRRVDTRSTEERTSVLHVRVLAGEQHGEPNAANQRYDHIAVSSPLGTIGKPSDKDSHGRSDSIRWDRHELRVGALVAHSEQNCRQEERERVERAEAAHVLERVDPRLGVLDRLVNVFAADPLRLGACLVVGAQTAQRADALVRGEEASGVGEIKDHPVTEDADEDGDQSLKNDCKELANRHCIPSWRAYRSIASPHTRRHPPFW